jgi:hypothetical protein
MKILVWIMTGSFVLFVLVPQGSLSFGVIFLLATTLYLMLKAEKKKPVDSPYETNE